MMTDVSVISEGCEGLTRYEIREKICRLEHSMLEAAKAGTFAPVDYPLFHQFAPHVYQRSIFLPAGTVIIGKLHRHSHFNWLQSGRVTMLSEFDGLTELRGPCNMLSPAGIKRAIYVHEDTIWTTVHPTEHTDLELIEAEVIAPSYTALGWEDPYEKILKLEGVPA